MVITELRYTSETPPNRIVSIPGGFRVLLSVPPTNGAYPAHC